MPTCQQQMGGSECRAPCCDRCDWPPLEQLWHMKVLHACNKTLSGSSSHAMLEGYAACRAVVLHGLTNGHKYTVELTMLAVGIRKHTVPHSKEIMDKV